MQSRYRTIDVVTIATIGLSFGVVFWAWGKFHALATTITLFAYPPSSALLSGMWLTAGIVGGLIIRKPGAALATEVIAAAISMFVLGGTEWGFTVLISGVLQGLGAELAFAAFRYRRFSLTVAMLAGALAASFEAVYEWFVWFPDWSWSHKFAHLGFFVISGVLLAGVFAHVLVRALGRSGALDAFAAGREMHV